MKYKLLPQKMSMSQADIYCLDNAKWRLPTANEAEAVVDEQDVAYWISNKIQGMFLLYDPMDNVYIRTHPAMLHHTVVVKA